MAMLKTKFAETLAWIKSDFRSHPWRLAGETYNWGASCVTAIWFAATVPNPPFLILYPLWLTGIAIMIACAYSRGSFGMTMLYSSMACIDLVGYLRLLLK
jgi:hypothetical protein